ncbi:MAG: hypothetical protein LJE59_11440 [Chromatiaceae bacterium]|nr:hypothetical protein [Chromatiaceae bacterium]
MGIFIESKFTSGESGLYLELTECHSPEQVAEEVRKAISRPGWSDSILINYKSLPQAARESWQRRVAAREKRTITV